MEEVWGEVACGGGGIIFQGAGEEELVNTLIVKYLFLSQDKQLMLFFHLF